MNLNQDFQEFIELFISHNVRFMIVGVMQLLPMVIRGTQKILMCGSGLIPKTPTESFQR